MHHGLWDYDFPAAPTLGTITVDGRRIDAVMQISKQGFVYVFDRRTGQPVWPIEERPVPQTTVPGEKTSPTQPFPTRPPAFDHQGFVDADVIAFTPEIKARALELIKPYVRGPLFTPPSMEGTIQLPANGGGGNWSGASFDPATAMLYVPSITSPFLVQLGPPPDASKSNMRLRRNGQAVMPTLDGLPLVKPPYSRITAYDMNTGTIAWQVPLGDGPRTHPLLKALEPAAARRRPRLSAAHQHAAAHRPSRRSARRTAGGARTAVAARLRQEDRQGDREDRTVARTRRRR